jgi:hypothetical protein
MDCPHCAIEMSRTDWYQFAERRQGVPYVDANGHKSTAHSKYVTGVMSNYECEICESRWHWDSRTGKLTRLAPPVTRQCVEDDTG